LRLAKEGFCGGDPVKIMESPVDWVMRMIAYASFLSDYESAAAELAKES